MQLYYRNVCAELDGEEQISAIKLTTVYVLDEMRVKIFWPGYKGLNPEKSRDKITVVYCDSAGMIHETYHDTYDEAAADLFRITRRDNISNVFQAGAALINRATSIVESPMWFKKTLEGYK